MRFSKYIKLAMVGLMCVSLVACDKKEPALNADRNTEMKYDFINLINVSVYGSEGNGFIEITPKDVSVKDFESEKDYIEIRKIMDSLGLYVGPDKQRSSYLGVSPNENLKNGDVVTIGIKQGWSMDNIGVEINVEPYQFEITTLQPGKELQIFDESSVQFYGLSGTKSVYARRLNGGVVPVDILSHLDYDITVSDSELQADKTIMSIKASIDPTFLQEGENPAYTTETYLGRLGYVAELSGEKVLTTVVDPINTNSIDKTRFAQSIINYLTEEEIKLNGNEVTFDSLATVQQSNSANGYDPFTYIVTFYVDMNGSKQCVSTSLRMVELSGEYIIAERMGQYNMIGEDICIGVTPSTTTLFSYVQSDAIESTTETESQDNTEVDQKDAEATNDDQEAETKTEQPGNVEEGSQD